MIFAVLPLLVVLVPFLLIATWTRRRDPDYLPWIIYAIALLLFTTLVSAVHVPFGAFLHSAVALIPHAYLLVLVGVAIVVRWVAARRSSWNAERASRNFSFMLVGVVAVASVIATLSTTNAWKAERNARAGVLDTLQARAEPGDVIMSPDAGAYRYRGGWSGIVTPDDPLPVVEEALRRYDIRWLALEGAHLTSALLPVLTQEVRPDWLSAPLIVVPSLPLEDDESADGPAIPRAALYAVCLVPDDDRCVP